MKPDQPTHRQGTILGGEVLFVKVGKQSVKDLSQPIKLTFKHKKQVKQQNQLLHHTWKSNNLLSAKFKHTFEYLSGGEWDLCVLAGVSVG